MQEQGHDIGLFARWNEWRTRHAFGGSAREMAYQLIRDKIIHLEFKPGEALNDRLLAEALDMSRTPVREALIMLASTNMVVFKPQSGTFVAPIDTEWMEMEQFSRCALEKEVVSFACDRMTEEFAQKYEENLQMYRHYASSPTPDRERHMLELDNDFHRLAFTAAGRENNYFHMLGSMQHIERMRFLSLLVVNQDEIYQDHLEISRALLDRDTVSALACLERHLNRYQDHLRLIQNRFPEYFNIGD